MRGNRFPNATPDSVSGSIPACAGEPGRRSPDRERRKVYPRVCGGTRLNLPMPCLIAGLSPRVRGNRRGHARFLGTPGSIPACAGEPSLMMPLRSVVKVYPRVCGGTCASRPSSPARSGLSPRVRGNPREDAVVVDSQGSIPACAGEPMHRELSRIATRVYPRVCGGTMSCPPVVPTSQGLSPRVRGNRIALLADQQAGRSIPACAGEPPRAPAPGTCPWVYPRVCGGTQLPRKAKYMTAGLSPRVRGNRRFTGSRAGRRGSIPACAGEPGTATKYGRTRKVYPRVCGGTALPVGRPLPAPGLSPRVRGNQPRP